MSGIGGMGATPIAPAVLQRAAEWMARLWSG